MNDVTQILHAIEEGDHDAADQLLAIVYDELHRMASRKLASEAPGQTLQTTALIHEAYMRLLPAAAESESREGLSDTQSAATAETAKPSSWHSRGHFFAAAAEAMRRILIDNARKKGRLKRGGDRARVDFDDAQLAVPNSSDDLLALDDALVRLESHDKQKADIVKLRYFAGLTLDETASALGVSVPTVHRHWRYARAWLRRTIEDA